MSLSTTGPPSNTWFLRPIRAYNPNGILIASAVFVQGTTVSLYFTMGGPFSPSKVALPMGGSGPPSNTWFLGPTRVLNPNGISISAAVFAGLTSVTDWLTDRPRYSVGKVTIGHIYVHSTVMRPNNNNNIIYTAPWSPRMQRRSEGCRGGHPLQWRRRRVCSTWRVLLTLTWVHCWHWSQQICNQIQKFH